MSWDIYLCNNGHRILIGRKDEEDPIPVIITCPWCYCRAEHERVVEKIYIGKEAQE